MRCTWLRLGFVFGEMGDPGDRLLWIPKFWMWGLLWSSHVGITFMSAGVVCVETIVIDFCGFGVLGSYWKDRVKSKQNGGQREP